MVSRLCGDEFALAMPVAADAKTTAERLVELLSRPYLIEGQVVVIGASIGLAVGSRDGGDPASLLRAADLALYHAKDEGRQAVRVFNKALDERARARSNLLVDLRRASALQQFELYFQPQTKLATGKLVGFEALIRWRHNELGLIPPDRFIPMARVAQTALGTRPAPARRARGADRWRHRGDTARDRDHGILADDARFGRPRDASSHSQARCSGEHGRFRYGLLVLEPVAELSVRQA